MFGNNPKKEKAIKLRREGKTYSEILKEVSVAKSTLSEWFSDVKLSIPEKKRLSANKLAAARRGGIAKHNQRLQKIEEIKSESLSDVKNISKRELLLIGTTLYWAEGSKEKDYYPGSGIRFSNSDPKMLVVFLRFLKEILRVSNDRIVFEIYIHLNSKNNIEVVKQYWAGILGQKMSKLDRVYYKKNNILTKRRKKDDLYYGLIRVKVKSSSDLLRKIAGWSEGIYMRL